MGLGKRLLLLAATLVVFNFVLWGIPKIAPEVPERYEGVSVAAPPTGAPTSSSTPTQPGFPSLERPPKIDVPDGQPQPIATKYGLTYDIPVGWDNRYSAVQGWDSDGQTVAIYGSLGYYARTDCSDGEQTELAFSGVTGRPDSDLRTVALAEAEKARIIYASADETVYPSVAISDPREFFIDGRPAVRYTATITNIPDAEQNCISDEASVDVVATLGYASAAIALFVVYADRGKPDALTGADIDQVLSTIRKS